MLLLASFLSFLFVASANCHEIRKYEDNWESIDSRPLPDWYDKAKIGIFLHWGVFSVPSFESEWFWINWFNGREENVNFMEKNYPPGFTYQDFARDFTAEFFDPAEWAALFKQSGAKYVVLTSKHHEGYTLWPSSYSYSWNAMDVGPRRDLLGDLAQAIRDQDLVFGVYYSLFEWFNRLYLADKAANFTSSTYVDTKALPELKELITTYKPEVLWSDGDWETDDVYWKSTEFLAWLYNDSPVKETVVTNDRWGAGTGCLHGGFLSCADRYNPGHLMPRKWENAMTVDRQSWGYRRNLQLGDLYSIEELIGVLVETVSFGGNILINVGPTKEGTILPIFQERLIQLGQWLDINGDAIYETSPWSAQNDSYASKVWYTAKQDAVYAIVLDWPEDNLLSLGSVGSLFDRNGTVVTILNDRGDDDSLSVEPLNGQVDITLPDKASIRSQWAWVLKIVPA